MPAVVYDGGGGCIDCRVKTRGRITAATPLPCEVYARREQFFGSINGATTTEAAAADCRKDAGERTGVRSFL